MIHDVIIEQLDIISNEKGNVMKMLKNDAPFFKSFGEVYFSEIQPGHVKGWKKHLKQTQHFVVPQGNIQLVLVDLRDDSPTKEAIQEIEMGKDNYKLVRIPCGIWYGFQALNNEPALIVNCTDIPHDPEESIQADLTDRSIPYSWKTL